MAHLFNSGGMRRIHLRRHDNIIKRLVIHAAGFNLGLVMRTLFGVGKPRVLQGHSALAEALLAALEHLHSVYEVLCAPFWPPDTRSRSPLNDEAQFGSSSAWLMRIPRPGSKTTFTTGC